jgi:hypothetical protein
MLYAGQYMGESFWLYGTQVDLLRAEVGPIAKKEIHFVLVFAGHSGSCAH